MKNDVYIIESPVSDQVDLAAATFLSRRSIQANDARRAGLFEPVLDGNCCTDRTGAEQVMSAGLARGLALDRAPNRYVILVDSGQGVVFRENTDDRPLGAKSCYERGGNSGYSSLDFKSLVGHSIIYKGAYFQFLVADLGKLPQVPGESRCLLVSGIDELDNVGGLSGGGADGKSKRDERTK